MTRYHDAWKANSDALRAAEFQFHDRLLLGSLNTVKTNTQVLHTQRHALYNK